MELKKEELKETENDEKKNKLFEEIAKEIVDDNKVLAETIKKKPFTQEELDKYIKKNGKPSEDSILDVIEEL